MKNTSFVSNIREVGNILFIVGTILWFAGALMLDILPIWHIGAAMIMTGSFIRLFIKEKEEVPVIN